MRFLAYRFLLILDVVFVFYIIYYFFEALTECQETNTTLALLTKFVYTAVFSSSFKHNFYKRHLCRVLMKETYIFKYIILETQYSGSAIMSGNSVFLYLIYQLNTNYNLIMKYCWSLSLRLPSSPSKCQDLICKQLYICFIGKINVCIRKLYKCKCLNRSNK